MPANTPDIFDQWTHAAPLEHAAVDAIADALPGNNADTAATAHVQPEPGPESGPATPSALRRAVQELLKYGLLEQSAKPHLFRQIASQTIRVDALLEPLDLRVRVDDQRGLALVAIADTSQADGEDEDGWTHPLVRRQRLTLEQSLLLAILRREFLQREQEHGLGAPVRLVVDSLLPQLEIYLGNTGSDMQERKRLVNLLENLRGHGVVSEMDAEDRFTIRPMIVHLANPENLQALLQQLRQTRSADATPGAQA